MSPTFNIDHIDKNLYKFMCTDSSGKTICQVQLENIANCKENRHESPKRVLRRKREHDPSWVSIIAFFDKEDNVFRAEDGGTGLKALNDLYKKSDWLWITLVEETTPRKRAKRIIDRNALQNPYNKDEGYWSMHTAECNEGVLGSHRRFEKKLKKSGIKLKRQGENSKRLDGRLVDVGGVYEETTKFSTQTLNSTLKIMKVYFVNENTGKIDRKILEKSMFQGVLMFVEKHGAEAKDLHALNNFTAKDVEDKATNLNKKSSSGNKASVVCKALEFFTEYA